MTRQMTPRAARWSTKRRPNFFQGKKKAAPKGGSSFSGLLNHLSAAAMP